MILKRENTLTCNENSFTDPRCLELNTELTGAEARALILMSEIFRHVLDTRFREDRTGEILLDYLESKGTQPQTVLDLIKTGYLKIISGKEEPPENIRDLILLWVMNRNPALEKIRDSLISDSILQKNSSYDAVIGQIRSFFKDRKDDPVRLLLSPAEAAGNSLEGQLAYILKNFGKYKEPFTGKILRVLDTFREENKGGFPPGRGDTEVLTFSGEDGRRNFSRDSGWMPNTVMIAKSTYVWLDQLSKKYGYSVKRLDEIPEEEIRMLSEWGINTLWLIGLWERSPASRKIKAACGNPEAAASAYSLKNYEIAENLGGWEALNRLKEICASKGIRLASDMVPNHTGIDSDWIQNHPERFIQLPYSPFPGYTFNGPDLSSNPSKGIFLEDHYYTRTDAAVVFKLVDFNTGETRYIYHGNDGTSMPWNDTAQLNYLDESVREAVINTIIHVARNFPVIRFDAAMTLARKHIQRLWYPAPGQGGDIPSRSEYGMSEEEFNRKMPKEFWREVVDRVAKEAPDTLLLAEAFWMMEGYFVKTLGMHRVYNSSFMNMLKEEENRKYRDSIKNTLLHDPEILKRFVNFMNNPDEETAVRQFGKGDKYFGVCTMMATLPGLPMFGHGQIEGFEEKYGMEYTKAYMDETPDGELIDRHKREIFPLLKRRSLFSESKHFHLYDLVTNNGTVNEDVFVWSNRDRNESCIVVYNNSPYETSGFITKASPKIIPETGETVTVRISSAVGMEPEKNSYLLFTEFHSGLTYITDSEKFHLEGLSVRLRGYENKVFLNFTRVNDRGEIWRKVSEILGDEGSKNILRVKRKIMLKDAGTALADLLSGETLEQWEHAAGSPEETERFASELIPRAEAFYSLIKDPDISSSISPQQAAGTLSFNLGKISALLASGKNRWDNYFSRGLEIMPEAPFILLLRALLSPVLTYFTENSPDESAPVSREMTEFAEDLGIGEEFTGKVLVNRGVSASDAAEVSLSGRIAVSLIPGTSSGYNLENYLDIPVIRKYLGINTYRGIEWFKRETFQSFIWWIYTIHRLYGTSDTEQLKSTVSEWILAEEKSDCELNKLLEYCTI